MFDPIENRTRVLRFSSRRSIYLTIDRQITFMSEPAVQLRTIRAVVTRVRCSGGAHKIKVKLEISVMTLEKRN